MRALNKLAGSLTLLLLLAGTAWQASAAELANKTALQVDMQRHIDKNLIDGAYLYLDTTTGEAKRIYPITAHPMILEMGEHYILCSEFRNKDGGAVNVDFYMVQSGDGYSVFHTAIDDREMLEAWMKEGRAKRLQ